FRSSQIGTITMCRIFLLAVFLLAVLVSQATAAEPEKNAERVLRQKTEQFDKDPAWDGQNNRVQVEKPNPVIQDFGYSPTNHAGGKAAGEIGGRIQRSTTSAFYGMRLEKPKTMNDK